MAINVKNGIKTGLKTLGSLVLAGSIYACNGGGGSDPKPPVVTNNPPITQQALYDSFNGTVKLKISDDKAGLAVTENGMDITYLDENPDEKIFEMNNRIVTDGQHTYLGTDSDGETTGDIVINASSDGPSIDSIVMNDTLGNNNGVFDAGETLKMVAAGVYDSVEFDFGNGFGSASEHVFDNLV